MDETAHDGVAFPGLLPLAVLVVVLVVPYWKIWSRTGHSGAWGLLMVIPPVNIVALWVLAFKEWPALRGKTEDNR